MWFVSYIVSKKDNVGIYYNCIYFLLSFHVRYLKDHFNPRVACGGLKFPPLRFVLYLRNLMSYERETWYSFK